MSHRRPDRQPDKRAFNRFVAAFIGLFAVVRLTSLIAGLYLENRAVLFHLRAKTAAGTVLTKRTWSSYKAGSQTHYRIAYRFTGSYGEALQGEDSAKYWQWAEAAPGTPVTVYYLSDDPHSNRLSRPWGDVQSLVLLSVGGLFSWFSFVAGRAVFGDRIRAHR